jgi:hypothetical protein
MSTETNYKPGHSVHFIQARLALEENAAWRPAMITKIGEGTIQVREIGGVESTYKCAETERLREIFESGRVPDVRDGKGLAILAPHGVLIVPCADEGKTFPRQAEIAPNVVYIENGAAHYSPTTDGAWHLFSIDKS